MPSHVWHYIIVNEDNGIPFELAQYLKRPVCPRHTNPIEEWEQYKQVYPNLYLIAQKYIGILATSVPCERLFSKAGLIITQRRNRLSSENLDQQLFLQNISEEDWFKK
ncbi:Zinc finger BED domain-containing protein 1 [Lucilia cuprina]|nr:Zinc finger BED domain-containing protein 1 [Lucilia cuprina]